MDHEVLMDIVRTLEAHEYHEAIDSGDVHLISFVDDEDRNDTPERF